MLGTGANNFDPVTVIYEDGVAVNFRFNKTNAETAPGSWRRLGIDQLLYAGTDALVFLAFHDNSRDWCNMDFGGKVYILNRALTAAEKANPNTVPSDGIWAIYEPKASDAAAGRLTDLSGNNRHAVLTGF